MIARASYALILLALAAPARGDGTVLVELFTSEGCSSCPPADGLLARIAHEGGAHVVALSEHVDYWDELGWRDRFSSSVFTRRQEAYVRRLRLTAPYTPQLVVGGRTDVLGSDARAARRAIAAAASEETGRIAARLVPAGAGVVAVRVDAAWTPGISADVLGALVQEHATTRVAGGENAGRTLEHISVARSLRVVGSGVGAFAGRVDVVRRDAPEATRLVLFVQERDGGPVHTVASVAIP